MIPALSEASRDPALKGSPVTIYVWLVFNLLELEEFRPLKIEGIAAAIDMHPDTVSRSVRALVERGYIRRRYIKRQGYEYRLLMHRDARAA